MIQLLQVLFFMMALDSCSSIRQYLSLHTPVGICKVFVSCVFDDFHLPVANNLSRGSVRSTGIKSLSQVISGSALPMALHNMTVLRSFSTAFSVGLSEIRGYPLGTENTETKTLVSCFY